MKKVLLVYDDTTSPNDRIKTIIGNRSFSEIIFKRKKLYSRVQEMANETETDIDFIKIKNVNDFKIIEQYPKETIFFHLLSNAAIIDVQEFSVILEKLIYVNETSTVRYNEKTVGVIFTNKEDYTDALKEYKNVKNLDFIKDNIIETKAFIDLTDYNNLLMYISSGFDTRYFNSIQGDNYTVTKKSKDKKKIKMEYSYYWLLPERMKNWMVMPYDYKEEKDYACYTMERMPMIDIAIRWTHGAIDEEEFRKIMDKIFYFIQTREEKEILKEEYINNAEKLYLKKLDDRVKRLKELPEYEQIKGLIANGTEYKKIDEIIERYKSLHNKITTKLYKNVKLRSVIGHGDVFFANMLYSKEENLLRLIDPKGAIEEKDLWTDPYYDVAKLSHSVCGNYDFFNTDSYDINLNKKMKYELSVHFDNSKYIEIFKEYLEKAGYDYLTVRLYEASLFLSMLPLHIDNPHKTFGFILNAINILNVIEKEVQ